MIRADERVKVWKIAVLEATICTFSTKKMLFLNIKISLSSKTAAVQFYEIWWDV